MVERSVDDLRQRLDTLSDPVAALASLVALHPDALALCSLDGICVAASPSFAEILHGASPVGSDLCDNPAFVRTGVAFWLKRAFDGDPVTAPTFWHECLDPEGRRRRIALSASAAPLPGSDGRAELVAIHLRDRTDTLLLEERRRLEVEEPRRLLEEIQRSELERRTNEEQFRAVFDQCSEGVLITDDSGRVLDINPAGCTIVQRPREETLGRRFWENLEDQSETRRLSELLMEQGRLCTDVCMRRADGQVRELELRSVANFLPHRHLTTFLDVTDRNLAQRALQANQRQLQLIIDSAPVGIAYLDTDSRHVFVNAPYARRVGRAPESLAGVHIRAVWGNDLFRIVGPQVEATLAGQPVEFEISVDSPGPDAVFARASHVPHRDDEGRVCGVVVVITDVTEVRRNEEKLRSSQAHLVASQRIAHVGSWELWLDDPGDLGANPMTCSDECYRIFGFEPGSVEVTAERTYPLVHRDDRRRLLTALREAVETGGIYSVEHRILRADGVERVVHARAEMVRDPATGRLVKMIGTTQDITERSLARLEIQQLNEELERRVADRTARLAEANHDLEAFAYSVSHDLRAPLRAINGYARILLDEHPESLDDSTCSFLERIEGSARRMARLIDDLLAFSRLGRQAMHMRPVQSRPILLEALEEIEAVPAEGRLEIAVGTTPDCRADPGLLKQVFVNLLGNAVKFSRERRPARIEVDCRVDDSEQVWCVRDNGIGFDTSFASKIFDVFQRLPAAGEYEGTGVGLALVERIVSRHGGRTWAESKAGEGAAFYFTLPLV